MPPLERTRLALCAAAMLGCLLLYALGDLLGVALYEAMGFAVSKGPPLPRSFVQWEAAWRHRQH